MKNHIRIAAIIICSITVSMGYAEENIATINNTFANALGFYAASIGASSGLYGLHYQHWAGDFGFQITGGGTYTPNYYFSGGSLLDYSVALEGLWTVYGGEYVRDIAGRLYLWAMGGHHGYLDDTDDTQNFVVNFTSGLGIGIETILYQHFSIPIEFGYTAEFPTETSFGFSFGAGLRYRY